MYAPYSSDRCLLNALSVDHFFVARINNLLNNDRAVIVSYSKGAINLKVIIVVLNLSVGNTSICI